MKLLVISILIALSFSGYSQSPVIQTDSLLLRRIEGIQWNLNKSHEVFSYGTNCVVTGLVIGLIGTSVAVIAKDPLATILCASIGSAFTLTGWAIQMHSNKYIGRAGTYK